MRYRLSTLLIVVTACAMLFTQHASSEGTFYVAALETAILGLWAALRKRAYPLIALVNLASVCVVIHVISAFGPLVAPNPGERMVRAIDASLPMVFALYGSVAIGYLTYRCARALIRQRRALVVASFRARRRLIRSPDFHQPLSKEPVLRKMQFHLSTLMVIVSAVAILISQRHSAPLFIAVGVVEMMIAFGWMAAVGRSFPWNAVVCAAIGIEILAFAAGFLTVGVRFVDVSERVANAVLMTATVGIVLTLMIGLFYLTYSVVKDPFRLNLPSPGAFRGRRQS